MIFVWKDINDFPPPDWDHVYVTVLDEDGDRYVTTGYYRPNSKDWIIFKDHYNSPTEFTERELDAKVIAWQEIQEPRPYQNAIVDEEIEKQIQNFCEENNINIGSLYFTSISYGSIEEHKEDSIIITLNRKY